MNLHYIQQNSLNPFEFQICQAYYENPKNLFTIKKYAKISDIID